MTRRVWLAVAGGVTVVVAVTLLALPGGPEWTSSSPEAVRALEAGIEAQMKVYHDEAARHFERALELDPGFVMARLMLPEVASGKDIARGDELLAELADVDGSQLSPRERLLLERFRLARAGRVDEVDALVDAYLRRHPSDPFVLHMKSIRLWQLGELEQAEQLSRHLAEVAPNWVIAYNQLGYITMMGERFAEAREYFVSYRFIAPDQANPHDSLGELHLVQGEYDAALASFRKALAIKEDFLPSWEHQVLALVVMGRDDEVEEVLADLETRQLGPPGWLLGLRCFVDSERLLRHGRYAELIARVGGPCLAKPWHDYTTTATHLAAVRLGDLELAESLEGGLRAMLDQQAAPPSSAKQLWAREVEGGLAHMTGVRLAATGDLEAAARSLLEADERLLYNSAGQGLFKTFNRLLAVQVLRSAGREDKAEELLARARSVNPVLVAELERTGLDILR